VGWDLLAIRTEHDTDGRLYPLVGSGSSPFELEPDDGQVKTFIAKGMSLRENIDGEKRLAFIPDVRISLSVTESRVVIGCEHWNKGNRYWGVGLGATSALVSNVTNQVREARARRGAILLGHIRYNWLSNAGCQLPTQFMGGEILRLTCYDGYSDRKRLLLLDIGISRAQSSAYVANLISSRAAQFWLARPGDLEDDARQQLSALAAKENLVVAKKRSMTLRRIPVYQKVHEQTA
jgi:hypothetical protein